MSHSVSSSRFRVEVREGRGRCCIAQVDCPAGTLVGVFGGEINRYPVEDDGSVHYGLDEGDYVIDMGVYDGWLFGLLLVTRGAVDVINHSCQANCRLDGPHRLSVILTKDLKAGDEVLLDYRTFNHVPVGKVCWCDKPEGQKCVI